MGFLALPSSEARLTTLARTRLLWTRSDEGLTLETSAFRISVRWPIYIINSVDKTKFLYTSSPPTQHHSFFRHYALHSITIYTCQSTIRSMKNMFTIKPNTDRYDSLTLGQDYNHQTVNPSNQCEWCDLYDATARANGAWSYRSAVPCDDQNRCTKQDTCNSGR